MLPGGTLGVIGAGTAVFEELLDMLEGGSAIAVLGRAAPDADGATLLETRPAIFGAEVLWEGADAGKEWLAGTNGAGVL